MKHLRKLAMSSLNNLNKNQLIKALSQFSSRIDLLENFIDTETDFDGQKVGYTLTHGPTSMDWYKSEYYQIDGTVKLPNGAIVIPADKKLEKNQ